MPLLNPKTHCRIGVRMLILLNKVGKEHDEVKDQTHCSDSHGSGSFAGVSFAAYAHTVSGMYDEITRTPRMQLIFQICGWKTQVALGMEKLSPLCEDIASNWPDSVLVLNECEPRLRLDGTMSTKRQRQGKEKRNSPSRLARNRRGSVDRVWMPSHHCCSGRVATGESEIVIDARVATGMEISLGDSVTIGAGNGRMNSQ